MEVNLTNPIADLNVSINVTNSTFDLFNHFDDPFTTGLLATFDLADSTLGNNGIVEVVLFDQPGSGAPNSVANFRNYAEDGDYENTFIHRSIPGFIIQGGGFTVNSNLEVSGIPSDSPVENEFSAERSNVRGTIAFAKVEGDPDSATSQWFFNLGDNSENLDSQNGGFTVFGQVVGEEDLATIDAIADIPVFDATNLFNEPAFTNLPADVDPNNPVLNSREDLVLFENITVFEVSELAFSVTNSNPDLVSASVNSDGELVLDYQPDQVGTAEITVEATNLLGQTETDTFAIIVGATLDPDGDDRLLPTVDGVLLQRFVGGGRGDALINGLPLENLGGNRQTAAALESFLDTAGFLDVDGENRLLPTVDGVLLQRFVGGGRGDALINGLPLENLGGNRQTAAEIEAFITPFLPSV
jgi:cyclophilin family peptidyl-prolyl cis-trans isomerase